MAHMDKHLENKHFDYILFGGTTEGRLIAEAFAESDYSLLVNVATEYGAEALEAPSTNASTNILVQRLNEDEMAQQFLHIKPIAIIDATHPYAALASENIHAAAKKTGFRYIRVLRYSTMQNKKCCKEQYHTFKNIDDLITWLNQSNDIIFSTLGAKDLPKLSTVHDFNKRMYVRILPTVEGISDCKKLGFPMKHIYALYGPFSEEFNIAQFKETNANILLTKDTGVAGGFEEKIRAAALLKMKIAILKRPNDTSESISLEEILKKLKNKEAL